ncbi:ABC-three component system protein [Alistipes onderdonkii]|jgi:hypothetical protein|uniref:ABC-three component systems C-terminal domain-containing protein n=1 Tax=Alistipes onderdonkii TaxID=328813 RepID=A0A1Y3QZU1_9BACT|nr:ABC-three component system protein [Alistipes onderdonkii]OUN03828.1 hypothetical protein B5G41_05015 [Alistipes onderdonkii]
MDQKVDNRQPIDSQVNIGKNEGNIYLSKKSRFSQRFEKLNSEVAQNEKYDEIFDDLKYYRTKLDGLDMPTKLRDGGFHFREIMTATRKKEKYAKKAERFKFFESAQWIDCQLFAKILDEYNVHVMPLIIQGANQHQIMTVVSEKVVNPVLELINVEGEKDEVLNYDAEDIYGMIYYLTGQCHINWKNYDNIQPGI